MPNPPDPPDPSLAATFIAPGVFIEEAPAGPPALTAVDVSTAGFVGPTRSGPLDGPPPLLTSLADFERVHGDGQPLVFAGQVVPNGMWLAARAFFAEGGRRLRVARVFRPDPAAAATSPDGIARWRLDGVLWSARNPGRAGNLRLQLTLRNGRRQGDGSIVPEPWSATRADLVASSPDGVVLGSWPGLSIDPATPPADGRRWLFEAPDPSAPDALPVIVQAQPGLDVETLLTWLGAWRVAARTDAARWADGITLTRALSGGHDGLPPGVADLGGPGGLARFDTVDDVALLAAPAVAESDLPAVHDLLLAQARPRPGQPLERFALLDAGPATTLADVQALRRRHDARCGALCHPWVQVDGTPPAALPPSAVVAGLIARVDQDRSVWKAPSGEPLRSVTGLAQALSKADQEQLGGDGVNPLVEPPGRGRLLWGARTLSTDPTWRYIPVARGMARLQASLERGMGWTVFEPNDEALWARVRATITALLQAEWRAGAFQGQKPEQAFLVRCDRTTMTQADLDAGRLIVLIGVAPLKPAEFVMRRVVLQAAPPGA
ncbi:phage tail sheath family protein [Leptothrix sp. BB-4]